MKRACQGFSLLEVLVAFVILALTLGVFMRIFSGGLGNIGAAENYSQAITIAESRLAAIGIETPLAEGESSGVEDRGYAWRSQVKKYGGGLPVEQGALPPIELFQVDVTVSWGDTASPRSLRLSTLRAARP